MKAYFNFFSMGLAAAVLLPAAAFAAPTVTFQGEVSSQTCSVAINGSTNSVVMLPTVATTAFGSTLSNGQTAGLTPFTVTVSGCTAPSTAAQSISTQFLGYNVDSTTGVLGNRLTSTNAAAGFGIQLTTSGTGGTPVVLNGPTTVAGLTLGVGQTSASFDFGARYYVLSSADAKPGKITAVAEYTLSYL
ncbi:MAG: Major fimbrial subunit SMF-1 [Candidatus Erwinia impunctatus]|nr:Major fimbrial subunit SMF-1 [Culicoides impunctatus]